MYLINAAAPAFGIGFYLARALSLNIENNDDVQFGVRRVHSFSFFFVCWRIANTRSMRIYNNRHGQCVRSNRGVAGKADCLQFVIDCTFWTAMLLFAVSGK